MERVTLSVLGPSSSRREFHKQKKAMVGYLAYDLRSNVLIFGLETKPIFSNSRLFPQWLGARVFRKRLAPWQFKYYLTPYTNTRR